MAGAATSSMPFGETYNWNKVFKIRDPEMRKKHFEAMEKEINKLLDGNNMRWEHLPPGEVTEVSSDPVWVFSGSNSTTFTREAGGNPYSKLASVPMASRPKHRSGGGIAQQQ